MGGPKNGQAHKRNAGSAQLEQNPQSNLRGGKYD